MLLGWLGAELMLLVIKVVLVLLDFCMALVPSLGKEFVLCCLVEGNPDIVIEVDEEGIVRGGAGGDCGGESSDSLANTVVSGTLLLLPYLLLMLLRTELEMLPEASSESLSCVLNLVESSEVGVVLNSEFLVMSFSDFDIWRELRELGRDDLRDLFEDWDGEREVMRLDLLPVCEPLLSICSTLENISLLQSEPILLRLASMDNRVLESAARADSKLPFQLNLSSSKCSDTPELDE